jgi:peptidyl-prolyl cis-trans isomerase C
MTTRTSRSLAASLGAAAVLLVLGCSKGQARTDDPAGAAATASAPAAAAATSDPAPPPQQAAPAAAPAAAGTPQAAPGKPAAEEDPILPTDKIPDVVATVDGQDVTKADLLARANEALGALAQRGISPPPPTRSFYRNVLDDLIGNRLLYKDLAAQNKAATPKEVDDQIAAIRAQFKSDEEFEKMLTARGFDRDRLKREVAESLTVNKWVENTVIPSLQVSDEEAKKFYDANQERMVRPESVRARHILVAVPADATAEQKAEKKKQAEALRAKIAGGEDFAAVAKASSDDKGSGARGGELGWLRRGQTVPAFDQAAFSLEPGKLSDVVESKFGYHIIEVEEKKPAGKLTFDEVKDRIVELIKQHDLENAIHAKLDDLGSKAKIEIKI